MRSAEKVARSGAWASSSVGTASSASAIDTPRRRSMRAPSSAITNAPAAMPKVLALTARPIAAAPTL